MIKRPIKSYVLRLGKITQGQQNSLSQFMPVYGINYQEKLIDLDQIFARDNPKIIEIGFGMGDATLEIAQSNPNNDYLGIEVHTPGVGALLMKLNQLQLTNLKVINHDAVEVLKYMISDNAVEGFHIYFPDPWPKKRHHKRRIMQEQFIRLLVNKLKPGGYIHFATDYTEYADTTLELMNSLGYISNSSSSKNFVDRPNYRPLTKFEKRGFNLGHNSFDLIFNKSS